MSQKAVSIVDKHWFSVSTKRSNHKVQCLKTQSYTDPEFRCKLKSPALDKQTLKRKSKTSSKVLFSKISNVR